MTKTEKDVINTALNSGWSIEMITLLIFIGRCTALVIRPEDLKGVRKEVNNFIISEEQ